MSKIVLILGASGKIGRHAQQAFSRAGWQVRCYDRKRGDLVGAARSVDVIVNGFNPPRYHAWQTLIPELTQQVIAAARASGATVIVPGNVYNIGAEGGVWSEGTPHRPNTRKGQVREEMERAYATSGVQTLILRAGNFIDPESSDDVMRLLLLRNIAAGKITLAGDPSAMQAYCYVPDWARAAVMLAERRKELSQFEDIPFAGHSFTAHELRQQLEQLSGRRLEFSRFPWWVMSLLSPFWELAREMLEMRYLWSTSHSLSNAKLSRLLPDFEPTPLDQVLRAAVQSQLGAAQKLSAPVHS